MDFERVIDYRGHTIYVWIVGGREMFNIGDAEYRTLRGAKNAIDRRIASGRGSKSDD